MGNQDDHKRDATLYVYTLEYKIYRPLAESSNCVCNRVNKLTYR